MNEYYDSFLSTTQQSNPQEYATMNQAQNNSLSDDFQQKAISQLSVADILEINTASTKKVEDKLNNVRDDFKTQVSSLDKSIKFLEAENCKKDEDNAVLKTLLQTGKNR